jgi:hypothetical protein
LAKLAVQCSADTFVVNHPDNYRDGSPHQHLSSVRLRGVVNPDSYRDTTFAKLEKVN